MPLHLPQDDTRELAANVLSCLRLPAADARALVCRGAATADFAAPVVCSRPYTLDGPVDMAPDAEIETDIVVAYFPEYCTASPYLPLIFLDQLFYAAQRVRSRLFAAVGQVRVADMHRSLGPARVLVPPAQPLQLPPVQGSWVFPLSAPTTDVSLLVYETAAVEEHRSIYASIRRILHGDAAR